jgi:hypothetical protein
MRYAFLTGGFCGFILAGIAGLMADRASEAVLRDAALSCLVSAFLFRWFWSVVVKVFIETAHQRRQQPASADKRTDGNQQQGPGLQPHP